MTIRAFTPAQTLTLSASGTSTSGTFVAQNPTMEIQNAGVLPVFVRWGTGAVTATAADYPVLGGQSKIVQKGAQATVVAVICPGGTATVYVTDGCGDL